MAPRDRAAIGFAGALLLVLGSAWAAERPADVTEPPAYEEFLIIPLRVHVLRAEKFQDVDCHLSDADLVRVLRKVNRIWHPAGVHFGLEAILREEAANQDRFRLARELADGKAPHRLFGILRPEESRRFDGLHVYYVHDFDVNGFYIGDGSAFVKETAALRAVEGGIDEPLPRVTAHELGHALGLAHRQDRSNLLASGTTGILLNTEEVARARAHARKVPGARTVAELRQAAEAAAQDGLLERARCFASWLAEIPGAPTADARRELEKSSP